jgi:glycosyltransferase involved in cell wall biosynthesis
MRPDCLLIEGCDFDGFPSGGQLAVAKQMMAAFGDRLALVGICTDDTPIGRWVQRELGGARYWFYGVGRRRISAAKSLVPARATEYLWLSRHREGVLSLGLRAAFLQAPEDLLVVARWRLESLGYCFPGVTSPLATTRYRWARPFARWFDAGLFGALDRADAVFASADERAIDGLVARSAGRLRRERVHALPTSYDSRVFASRPRELARRELGLASSCRLLVCNGRISQVKGWELLLEALQRLAPGDPQLTLAFVGDGEDRARLMAMAAKLRVADRVRVTGFLPPARVAQWLNAADLALVGSHTEGWSVAMLEALACGKPLVSTEVSGARQMIREAENGFIVRSRDPEEYAGAVRRALALQGAARVSLELARHYALPELARRIGRVFKPLS